MVVEKASGLDKAGRVIGTFLVPAVILAIMAPIIEYAQPGTDVVNAVGKWLLVNAPDINIDDMLKQVPLPKVDLSPLVTDQRTDAVTETVPAPEPAPELVHKSEVSPEHKPTEPRAVVRDYDLARLNLSQIAHSSEMTSRLPTTEEVASLSYNMRNMYGIELTESQIKTAFRDGYVEIRGERFQLWENNRTPEFYLTPTLSVR